MIDGCQVAIVSALIGGGDGDGGAEFEQWTWSSVSHCLLLCGEGVQANLSRGDIVPRPASRCRWTVAKQCKLLIDGKLTSIFARK